MSRPFILILYGGRSVEYEVSERSKEGIKNALDSAGFSVGAIRIGKNGAWGPVEGEWLTKKRDFHICPDPTKLPFAPQDIVVFPVLHGAYGEDGTIQGICEYANLPYVGCGVSASVVGLDKALQKEVFRLHGIPTVQWTVVKKAQWEQHPDETVESILLSLRGQYPLFIKPAHTGSSVGISKVLKKHTLMEALRNAFLYDAAVIAEQAVFPVREIEVGVLGNDDPEVSLVGEIIPDREFYDYASKYSKESKTKLRIDPQDIRHSIKDHIRSLALKAFQCIGATGLSRVDFFLSGDTVYLNEINTFPGFTTISMYPKLFASQGISFENLCTKLIVYAQETWKKKQAIQTIL